MSEDGPITVMLCTLDDVERLTRERDEARAEVARLIEAGCRPLPGDVADLAMEVARLRAWEARAREVMPLLLIAIGATTADQIHEAGMLAADLLAEKT